MINEVNDWSPDGEQKVYIEFLNSKKGFRKDKKYFKGTSYKDAHDKAMKWAKKTFDEFSHFSPDMIQQD